MKKYKKVTGTASTLPIGIVSGVLLGLSFLFGATFVSAWMYYNKHITADALGYLLMAGQFAGAMLGTWFSISRVKRCKLIVGVLTGGIMFLLLLGINAIFFGGHFDGVLVTAALLMAGSLLAAFIASKKGSGSYNKSGKVGRLCKIPNR